jgi:dUTP pyrophosphatase
MQIIEAFYSSSFSTSQIRISKVCHIPLIPDSFSKQDSTVEEGDRIAQLIIERIYTPDVLEVEVGIRSLFCPSGLNCLQDLDETVRGTAGFGSTGGHILLSTGAPTAQ